MLRLCAISALFLLGACATPPPPVGTVNQCPEPRPQVCTMEYAPVCATLSGGVVKEYASACNACADTAVQGYVSGPCPE